MHFRTKSNNTTTTHERVHPRPTIDTPTAEESVKTINYYSMNFYEMMQYMKIHTFSPTTSLQLQVVIIMAKRGIERPTFRPRQNELDQSHQTVAVRSTSSTTNDLPQLFYHERRTEDWLQQYSNG
eukprot:5693099-Amphidinium_carterae.1